MRAASLPRFLLSLIAARSHAFALWLLIAIVVLLAFGVTGAAAAGQGPSYEVIDPFRW